MPHSPAVLYRYTGMDLIIHKLMSDMGTLLSEIWQAFWHGHPAVSHHEPPISPIKPGSSGTRPIV